jgi:hypothetical protein
MDTVWVEGSAIMDETKLAQSLETGPGQKNISNQKVWEKIN